jgi:DNA invertase Pin-like site-specific DNA recombinase
VSSNTSELAGIAYSYIRFSSAEQERGDSLRRQRALRDEWLKRHPQVVLDTAMSLEDLGVSGYRGRHRSDKHALGQFLDAVRRGRVERGSILLLENLDRLSREEEEEALEVLLGLLRNGVVVVQLEPETVFRKGDGMIGLFRAIMELSRGHQESKRKSFRVAEAWRTRQRRAAEGKGIVTARCPAWLDLKDGKFHFKPGARDTIRRIFAESRAGRGARAIASGLLTDRVPQFAGGVWGNRYVGCLLRCRSVTGEMQPYRREGGKRVKDGAPVPGYFPAAVSEAEWYAVQAALKSRTRTGGHRGVNGWVPIFYPVYDARTGDKLNAPFRVNRSTGTRYRVLLQAATNARGQSSCSFPLEPFETNLIDWLQELDPADVLPPSAEGSRVTELAGRVAETEGRIAELQAALESGAERPRAALDAMANLEKKLAAQSAELAAARREVASPAHEQWGTLKGLAALSQTDMEARVRIRAALGRLIERTDCLIVRRGELGILVAQVTFRETAVRRYYMLVHKPARFVGRDRKIAPAQIWPVSFAGVEEFDLRDRDHAARLEKMLKTGPSAAG